MAFEVVDRQQWLVAAMASALAVTSPTITPADQPRPGGRGNRVDIGQRPSPHRPAVASISGVSRSAWARAAISGTTPP
jgi:hypothetical protein